MDNVRDSHNLYSDSTLFKLNKKKNPPQYKLYDVEILDHATGTIPQRLNTLNISGPFQARGRVHLPHNSNAKGTPEGLKSASREENSVYIKAESIIEWTHEYNAKDPSKPVFWILSENICWYEIKTFKPSYQPFIASLCNICKYLDTIIHLVEINGVQDDLSVIIPEVASILNQSEENVEQELENNLDGITKLCSADIRLTKLIFYKQLHERMAEQGLISSNSIKGRDTCKSGNCPSTPHLFDSEVQVPMECDDFDNADIPNTLQENYERLPAPCVDDLCPLHFREVSHNSNTISGTLESLINERFNQGNSSYSQPDVFNCPIPGCLSTITNVMHTSSTEYVGEILHHILIDYIAQTKRQKSMFSQRKKDTTQGLNLNMYWALKSGGFTSHIKPSKDQFNLNPPVHRRTNKRRRRARAIGNYESNITNHGSYSNNLSITTRNFDDISTNDNNSNATSRRSSIMSFEVSMTDSKKDLLPDRVNTTNPPKEHPKLVGKVVSNGVKDDTGNEDHVITIDSEDGEGGDVGLNIPQNIIPSSIQYNPRIQQNFPYIDSKRARHDSPSSAEWSEDDDDREFSGKDLGNSRRPRQLKKRHRIRTEDQSSDFESSEDSEDEITSEFDKKKRLSNRQNVPHYKAFFRKCQRCSRVLTDRAEHVCK
ncbi:hypothetical protein BGZ76_010863 [Entomortierella beljakovae]|nr:hypothetical protein BGZ76_010863 [Entomortierella beljakovae]